MAEIDWVIDTLAGATLPAGTRVVRWTLPAVNDTGRPYPSIAMSDKTVQVTGLSTSTLTIQGTNQIDPASATYATLSDPGGTALALTVDGMKLIAENPYQIRPILTGGANTNVVVRIAMKDPGAP